MNEELKLVRKIQKNGDRAAADELVRLYYDELYRFICKQISNGELALDLTQEVFISLLRTISRYDPKKGAGLRTWLYKIATDKIIDHFRSRAVKQKETLSLDEIKPIDETNFVTQLENQAFAEQVCAFVANLKSDTQKIFRLHIFGGYTFVEIAANMKIPESSVKSKYYRLLGTLRREFDFYDK